MKKGIPTQQLAYMALLISLNIILVRVTSFRLSFSGVEGIRIGFGGLPVIIAGFLFGPLAGGIVGAVGDLLGYFINPLGPYMPHFTFSAALAGFLPALVFSRQKANPSFINVLLAISLGQIITSLILVPWFLQMLFDISLMVTLPARLISQAMIIPLYSFIIIVVLKRLNMALILPTPYQSNKIQ